VIEPENMPAFLAEQLRGCAISVEEEEETLGKALVNRVVKLIEQAEGLLHGKAAEVARKTRETR
jgi:hypothetical protein